MKRKSYLAPDLEISFLADVEILVSSPKSDPWVKDIEWY